jgi:hypothetical protein
VAQPSQFQLNVAPARALPVKVKVEVVFVVELLKQAGLVALKLDEGVGSTKTTCEVIGEVQPVAPGFVTNKVIFLLPLVLQLTLCAPTVLRGGIMQPSQFQK